ncbi:hypothetical protein F66182_18852, partial [Fusarium sp. NRRL 66182]
MEYELDHQPSDIDSRNNDSASNNANSETETITGIEQQYLHPADRGLHAYLFLLSSFILEALIWGFAFTFGIFQQYYS